MTSSLAQSFLFNLPFLLLAATGGLLAERSGVAALCLEGLALLGAFTAVWAAAASSNLWLGLAAGIVGGLTLAAVHALAVLRYKVNHFVSGLVINLLSGPLCILLLKWQFGTAGQSPPVGVQLTSWNLAGVLVPLALPVSIGLFLVISWLLTKTRCGCWITACGQNIHEALNSGLPVGAIRLCTLLACGAFCGLAGAWLSLGFVDVFGKDMVAGRGYLAVAAVVMGGWRPWQTLIACIVLALLSSAQVGLQGLPAFSGNAGYLLPFVVLLLYLALSKSSAPMPAELIRSEPARLRPRRKRLAIILATGYRKDHSLNSYLTEPGRLKQLEQDTRPRLLISEPVFVGDSLADAGRQLEILARNHTHLVGIGTFMMSPFIEFSRAASSRTLSLAVLDGETSVPVGVGSVAGIRFEEEKLARPAGYLAAKVATEVDRPAVAFIGGCPVPAARRWAEGFRAGVEAFNKDTGRIGANATIYHEDFVGDSLTAFSSPETAQHITDYYLRQRGVSVLFQACGASCEGVFKAVERFRRRVPDVFVISADYLHFDRNRRDLVLFAIIRHLERAIQFWLDHPEGGIVKQGLDSTAQEGGAWEQLRSRIGCTDDFLTAWQKALNKTNTI